MWSATYFGPQVASGAVLLKATNLVFSYCGFSVLGHCFVV